VRFKSRYRQVDVVSVDPLSRKAAIALLWSIVVIGVVWALVQLFLTFIIAGIDETATFDFSLDQPNAAYALTGIVIVSVIRAAISSPAAGCGRRASRPSWEWSAH
jgi:ABC-type polysaccharide/polyol phosphate export permease